MKIKLNDKIVCFAGHRESWHCLNIQKKLYSTLENLILQGYYIFYHGAHGDFDKLCLEILSLLKDVYPHLKIYKILTHYAYTKSKNELPKIYEDSILPELESVYYKAKITKRNEWIIEHSDILISHIEHTINSGAYNMYKYAQKLNKTIIEL